mgnify:CR=1 FL=1
MTRTQSVLYSCDRCHTKFQTYDGYLAKEWVVVTVETGERLESKVHLCPGCASAFLSENTYIPMPKPLSIYVTDVSHTPVV